MDITPLLRPEQKIIQSYGAGFFRVNGVVYRHPILVTDRDVCEWGGLKSGFDQFTQLADAVDILLIGEGMTSKPMPPSERKKFQNIGVAVDVMDTASACRTFNVLTSEGRRVAAALMPI